MTMCQFFSKRPDIVYNSFLGFNKCSNVIKWGEYTLNSVGFYLTLDYTFHYNVKCSFFIISLGYQNFRTQ